MADIDPSPLLSSSYVLVVFFSPRKNGHAKENEFSMSNYCHFFSSVLVILFSWKIKTTCAADMRVHAEFIFMELKGTTLSHICTRTESCRG